MYYYEEVAKHSKSFNEDEEADLKKRLIESRIGFQRELFSRALAIEKIRTRVLNTNSPALLTNDFNTKKKGNNAKVSKRVVETLKEEPPSIDKLIACNFKCDFLEKIMDGLEGTDEAKKYLAEARRIENLFAESVLMMAVKMAANSNPDDMDDGIQTANLAVVEASQKYDPTRHKTKFVTYAHHKIRYALIHNKNEIPTVSMDSHGDRFEEKSVQNMIPDESESVESLVIRKSSIQEIESLMGLFLNPMESDIIYYRYLHDDEVMPFKEVRKMLEPRRRVSRHKLIELEKSAISKIKLYLR